MTTPLNVSNSQGAVGRLSQRLRAGESLFTAWCWIPEPSIAETLTASGFDTAVLDMQHGAFDVSSVSRAITILALHDKPAIVRVQIGDYSTASRMLDFGAAAVVAPMVNDAAEARRFVSFTKLPPLGERSWGPARAQRLTGQDANQYLHEANEMQLSIVMIETAEGLAALDAVLDVPGIDGVLIGAADLSIALSKGQYVDQNADIVDRELDRIVAACRKRDKYAMIACRDVDTAKAMSRRGFHVCSMGNDYFLLDLVTRQMLSIARSVAG